MKIINPIPKRNDGAFNFSGTQFGGLLNAALLKCIIEDVNKSHVFARIFFDIGCVGNGSSVTYKSQMHEGFSRLQKARETACRYGAFDHRKRPSRLQEISR
jgi:hypothetical protein